MKKPARPNVDPALFTPAIYNGPPAEHFAGICWHYTRSSAARRIVADGVLKPMPQRYTGRAAPRGRKDLLWFSLNHIWEPAACHAFEGFMWEYNGQLVPKTMTIDGMQSLGQRMVRFAVPVEIAPYSHHAAFRLAGHSAHDSRWLVRVGEQLGGKISDWRGTLTEVPKEHWLNIDVWRVDHWETVWRP